MPSTSGPRATWRKPLLAACGILASAPLVSAVPAQAQAQTPSDAAVRAGCCQALIGWSGALQDLAVLPERRFLTRGKPIGWSPFDPMTHYFLQPGKTLRTAAILEAAPTTYPSRARYRWQVECLIPTRYRKQTAWTWTNVPGAPSHSPTAPIIPIKTVYGGLAMGNCTKGFLWFQYDQGDPAYGLARGASFTPGRKRVTPKTITVWKWVSDGQATTVKRTGKYPMPKGAEVGQYFYFSRAYADKVAGHFKGHRLVRGTLSGADIMQYYTENKTADTGPVGAFFRKRLAQPKATFKVVK
ncbi:hypothetical protein ACIBF1_30725 [Spirillospora sp. NPDC050679]